MQALVIVIPHVALEREAQLAVRREPRAVDQLCLQRMKERLHMRVVARGDPGRQRAYGVVLSFAEGRADPRRAVRDGPPAAPRAPALRVVLQSPAPAFGPALSGAGGLRVASGLTRGVNETEGRSRARQPSREYVPFVWLFGSFDRTSARRARGGSRPRL